MADGDLSILLPELELFDAIFGGTIPTVEDVGAILRARTRSLTGEEIGTFDDTTRPTGEQVDNYIAQAVIEVGLRFPDAVPENLQPYARHLAALRAAMSVELSYWPEQTDEDNTVYGRLKEQFDAGMAALLAALNNTEAGRVQLGSVPLSSPFSGTEISQLDFDPFPPISS